jgi:hypothetical protein
VLGPAPAGVRDCGRCRGRGRRGRSEKATERSATQGPYQVDSTGEYPLLPRLHRCATGRTSRFSYWMDPNVQKASGEWEMTRVPTVCTHIERMTALFELFLREDLFEKSESKYILILGLLPELILM